MRTRNIYILSACLAAVLSCTEFQEENIEVNEAEKVAMTFTASICDETDPETKTVLDGQLGDELRKVLWTPNDEIGIVAGNNSSVEKFTNTETENTETACFEGSIAIADTYYAAYPYSGVICPDGLGYSALKFDLPQTQKYTAGSFGLECAPMVAKANNGEEFRFKNLCGILALNLTGTESVKSITFIGKDANGEPMYVSGEFVVNMNYEDVPTMEPAADFVANGWSSSKSVTLECEEPVQLNETEATTFYIALPPATYETFSLIISATDGKAMMKDGTKPLTIKRSDVQPTADLTYVETTVVDLSLNGLANCYIVTDPGMYSFDASTMGNGDFGIIVDNTYGYPESTHISPISAELLWCDSEGAISGVDYNNGRINFYASDSKGNAVIAAKDTEGNILWSWHIWMTDKPEEQTYKNNTGEYIVLDRNIGATRADRGTGDQWKEAQGLVYQWGRKDPFIKYEKGEWYEDIGVATYGYTKSSNCPYVAASIMYPTTFYHVGSDWTGNTNPTSLWMETKKTIYDPCPVGYTVASQNIWKQFIKDGTSSTNDISNYAVSGDYQNGWDFIYDGTNTAYYPTTYYIDYYYGNTHDSNYCYLWTSGGSYGKAGSFYYSNSSNYLYLGTRTIEKAEGLAVRCMKETNLILTELIDVIDITSTSATFNGKVSASSSNDIISKGFIYGNSPDISLDNGTVVECGSGSGTFSTQVENLGDDIIYVKAFAVTVHGTYYSQFIHFVTENSVNAGQRDMVFTVSANYNNNFTVEIPTYGTINCIVDWGDGNILNYTEANRNLSYTYNISEPAYFEVRISGTVTALRSNGNNSITEVKQWGLTGLTSMYNAFGGATALKSLCDDTVGAFSYVTTFEDAWKDCNTITGIPTGLFKYAVNAISFEKAFMNTGITELGANLFSSCSSAENFSYIFGDCTSLTSIDKDVFNGCSSVTDLSSAFYSCENLSTIPSGLFNSMANVKTFNYAFGGCGSITSLPNDLFNYCTETEDFTHCFSYCSSLSEIPKDLFGNNINAKDFSSAFYGCSAINTVPAELFSNAVNAVSFYATFGKTNIVTIPADLFKNCVNVEVFSSTFEDCEVLTSIPDDLFVNCSKVTNFNWLFDGCNSLASIPSGLFSSCPEVTSFAYTFDGCSSLTTIPESLFANCSKVDSFNSTFRCCDKLTSIPVSLFDNNRKVSDFTDCFYSCDNITGESPYTIIDGVKYHLYERCNNIDQFRTPTSTSNCFGYCSGLTDYDSIPNEWK